MHLGRDPQWSLKSPRAMLGRAAECRAARSSYRNCTRSAGLLGEEYSARTVQDCGGGDVFEGAWQYLVFAVGRERDVCGKGVLETE